MLSLLRRAARPLGMLRASAGDATQPARNDAALSSEWKRLRERVAMLERQLEELGVDPTSTSPGERDHHASEAATKTDLLYCFRLLLGRLPGEAEWSLHQRWVGQPLKDVVTLYLQSLEFTNRRLLKPPLLDLQIVDLPRFRMYVAPTDLAVGKNILACQTYEPPVTRAVERVLRSGMVFVDVGANVGYFSLLGASLVNTTGKVFAFEPSETNVKTLHLSAVLNGFQNIQVFPLAAGSA